jgi:hypothetical protein
MSDEEVLGLYKRYCKEELEIAKPSISDILRVRDSYIKQAEKIGEDADLMMILWYSIK